MPIARYFCVVGSALLALLFVFDACFGDGPSRIDRSLYESATYAPRPAIPVAAEHRLIMPDATPAARVKDVFGRFGPTAAAPDTRYSSIATVIR